MIFSFVQLMRFCVGNVTLFSCTSSGSQRDLHLKSVGFQKNVNVFFKCQGKQHICLFTVVFAFPYKRNSVNIMDKCNGTLNNAAIRLFDRVHPYYLVCSNCFCTVNILRKLFCGKITTYP